MNPNRYRRPGTRQLLLPVPIVGVALGRDTRTLVSQCHVHFAPLGLLLWGVTDQTLVHCIRSGHFNEVTVSYGSPVPGKWFAAGKTFDELGKLAEAGELDLAVEDRAIFEMTEAAPGVNVGFDVSGPVERACFWGLAYAQRRPLVRGSLHLRPGEEMKQHAPAEAMLFKSVYVGELVEERLLEDVVTARVTADTEAGAIALLGLLGERQGS